VQNHFLGGGVEALRLRGANLGCLPGKSPGLLRIYFENTRPLKNPWWKRRPNTRKPPSFSPRVDLLPEVLPGDMAAAKGKNRIVMRQS